MAATASPAASAGDSGTGVAMSGGAEGIGVGGVTDAAGISGMTLLHDDPSFLLFDKPAGLLSVPGRLEPDCLAARAQRRWPDALVVHRLDMATSGLWLMARGIDAQRRLSAAFERRETRKRYVAVVHGLLRDDTGRIDLPLAADWPNRPRQRIDPKNGRPARTNFRVLARDAAAGTTRVELEPVTGRSHQLRVHLLALGHPIVGDALYAPERPAARLLLHATGLTFAHPLTDDLLVFHSAPPF